MRIIIFVMMVQVLLFAGRTGGPYIGIGYGMSKINDKGYYTLDSKNDSGILFCGGAYINENFSVEVERISGMKYQTIDAKTEEFTQTNINTQVHYQFLKDRLDTYGKFGVGAINNHGNAFSYILGIGMAYRVTPRYGIRVGYNYINFGIDTIADRYHSADKKINIDHFFCAFEVQF